MTKKWLIAMLGAAAMTASAGALAQAAMPLYVGVDVGKSDIASEDDIGFKLYGGYQFHRNVSAEIGYGLLFDKSDVEVTALEFVAVGMYPVAPQLSLIGKLGLANVEVDSPVGSDDKTELTFGIGAQFDFSRNLSARVMWQRYDTEEELDFFSVGVVYRF